MESQQNLPTLKRRLSIFLEIEEKGLNEQRIKHSDNSSDKRQGKRIRIC